VTLTLPVFEVHVVTNSKSYLAAQTSSSWVGWVGKLS